MKTKIPGHFYDFFECEDFSTKGRLFTIGHFLVALYLVAKKLFALAAEDEQRPATLLFKLLERMDVSTPGKIIFTAERNDISLLSHKYYLKSVMLKQDDDQHVVDSFSYL